jgi:hypothetical protein
MVGSWATTLLKWPLGAVEAGLSAVPDEEPSVKGASPVGLADPCLGHRMITRHPSGNKLSLDQSYVHCIF